MTTRLVTPFYALIAISLLAVAFVIYAPNPTQSPVVALPESRTQVAQLSGASSGLVGWWSFDEGTGTNAADSSGNGNAGTLLNGATWTTGKVGSGALSLDGIDDYVEVPGFSQLQGSNQATISFWLKPENDGGFMNLWGTSRIFEIYESFGNYRVYWKYGGTASGGSSLDHFIGGRGGDIDKSVWQHVVFIYNSPDSIFYKNGVLVGTVTGNGGSLNTNVTAPLEIGFGMYPTGDYMSGQIDDVRIYNRALSASEVQGLHNLGSGGGLITSPSPSPSPDTTSPTVSSVTSSSITNFGATISWTTNEPADTQVEYGLTTAYGSQTSLNTTLSTSHNVILSGLLANTVYNYRVKSKDAAGNLTTSGNFTFTTQSIVTADTIPPSIPTGLSATVVSANQINLSWNSSTDNVGVTGYRIYRGGTQIATVTGTSYSNTALTANTVYSYTVAAYDAAGNVSAQSGSVSATTQSVTVGQGGQAYEWGINIVNRPTALSTLTDAVEISGNSDWSLARRANGSLVAWGSNSNGQQNVPTGTFVSSFAGWQHGIACRSDGTVEEWGNPYGKTEAEWEALRPAINNCVQVAAGDDHSVALLADGRVLTWGGRNSVISKSGTITDAKQVASGWYHVVVLHQNGTVSTFGEVTHGGNISVPVGLNNVVKVAASQFASYAIKSDGTLVAWGPPNDYGQLTPPSNATNLVSVSGGRYHTVAARADGTVVAWGDNSQGQINVPSGLSDIVFVGAGRWHSQAIKGTGSTPPPPPPTTDTIVPSIPTGLSATAISSSQINLSWNASTDNVGVTGYRIYRGGTQIATVSGTAYSNTALTANTTYSYTVAAYDAAGNVSIQSTSVSATTQPTSPVSTKFSINDRVQVTNGPVNVRATANGTVLGSQATGNPGTVIGGPTQANSLWWWNINYDSGVDGWTAEDFLSIYSAPPVSIDCSAANVRCVDDTPGSTQEYATIQACADAALPGDTCLIQPGNYGRTDTDRLRVGKSGTPGNPITFKALPGVTANGFYIRNGSYFKIEGFTFTGDLLSGGGAWMVEVIGDHNEIANNTFTGTFTSWLSGMIQLYGDYNHAHHNTITDWIPSTSEATAITAGGSSVGQEGAYNIVEYNIIKDIADIDVFEAFGHDQTFRNNVVMNIYDTPNVGTHIDFAQTFGNNGNRSYNILFENNFISGIEGQITQLEQRCGWDPANVGINDCGLYAPVNGSATSLSSNTITDTSKNWITGNWLANHWQDYVVSFINGAAIGKAYIIVSNNANTLTLQNPDGSGANLISDGVVVGDSYEIRNRIGWWTFKNNVYHNTQFPAAPSQVSASLPYLNFINNTFIDTRVIFSGGSAARGRASKGEVTGNVHISSQFIYGLADPVSKNTFHADYNFHSFPGPGYEPKDERCSEEYAAFRFCEEIWPGKHGINGGNPMLQNINNPLGPDGIAWTSDDGLRPLAGSPLCGAGQNGSDIGAYSCSGSGVPPPTTDTTVPSIPTGLSATTISSSQINLSWNSSTDNVGVAGYRIYRGGTQIATVTGTSYSNTALTANTTYSYTVAAYDAAGNASLQSGAASATTQSGTVSTKFSLNDRVRVTEDGINIRSTAGGTIAGSQNTGALGTVIGGPQTATVSGITYTFWNVNFDVGVDGWTAEDFLAIYSAPPVSTNCSAANVRCVPSEYPTIQACANAAVAGDTCLVSPGNYPEHVETARGGTAGNYLTFKAVYNANDSSTQSNQRSTTKGFRIKNPYVRIEGFDITKYTVGLNQGHITVEPAGDYCQIADNVIRNGVYLTSFNYFFDAQNKTVTNSAGGFLAAGFQPGMTVYIGSNINNQILNHDTVKSVAAVTDTTLTFSPSTTVFTEGPVNSTIYANRAEKIGVGGIVFMSSSANGNPDNCLITDNRLTDLAGRGLEINGSNHLITRNTLDRMNGWRMITFFGSNNRFAYNVFKDSPRWPGFPAPLPGTQFSQGTGTWDMYDTLMTSFGAPDQRVEDNIFEYNFIKDIDEQFATVLAEVSSTGGALPVRGFTLRNNVFVGMEMTGSFTRPETKMVNNTFYKNARSSPTNFSLGKSVFGNPIGSVIENNAFVESGDLSAQPEQRGWYSILGDDHLPTQGVVADYNFVAGAASAGYPAKVGFQLYGAETNGINGGNPLFANQNNPLGSDGTPFTSDDGLIPLAGSPLCTGGRNGGYIGAYPCTGSTPPPTTDTTSPSVTVFTIPSTSSSLTIPITTLTASDNIGVTGYRITESTTAPSATSIGWTSSAPTSYTVTTQGTKTLYAWAKDAAGNVSASRSASVTVTVTTSLSCSATNVRCVDDTPGSTQEYPTVQACANVANAGDTCLVHAGNYPEYVQLDRGGVAGTPLVFKANGVATIEGFRIKKPYITIDGFDITKYANGLSPANITVEPQGSYCSVINNTIRDGVQVLSNQLSFNASTRTITNPAGGFLSAGFRPGTVFYIGTNINNEIQNGNKLRTIKSVTDTTITVNDTETLITEGPVLALIYATRGNSYDGVAGLSFVVTSSAGTASNCLIRDNRVFNLSGNALNIYGSYHLVERNTIERMNGWRIFDLLGNNNVIRYNYIRNSPRYSGFEPPITCTLGQTPGNGCAPDQSTGGHWDFVAQTWRSFGNTSLVGNDNIIEYNFIDNIDNQLFNITEKSAIGVVNGELVYGGAETKRLTFKNNVIFGLEFHGAIHRPDSIIENNTFYKSAPESSAILNVSSGYLPRDVGSAEGSIVRNNAFVGNGVDPDVSGTRGWYNIENIVNYVANWNFVAGPASQGFPAKAGFIGEELNGINGGNPNFQNISNPVGPDGIPFTSDDGLIPLAGSPLCTGGQNGGYIGAYPCTGSTPPPTTDTTSPSIPTGLSATAVSSSQINLSWNASTDNVGVAGYRIYRGGTQIATVSGTTYSNTALTANTTYSYTVAAYDAAGNASLQSGAASATTQPTSPVSTKFSINDRVYVTEDGINIRSTAGGTILGSQNTNALGTVIGGPQIATVSGVAYTFWNVNFDVGVDGWTAEEYMEKYTTTADTTSPSIPTGLSATAVSSSQINLSWNASTDNVGVAGYRIYRGGTQIATVSGTTYSNTALTANTTYSYTVAAYDAAGNASLQSGAASATTQPQAVGNDKVERLSSSGSIIGTYLGGTAIQSCASAVNAGETCLVYAGNYERTDLRRGGTSGNLVTFRALPGAISNGFYIRNVNYVKIDGFTFTGNVTSVGSWMVHVLGNNVEIANNTFTGTFTTWLTGMIILEGSFNHAHHNTIINWIPSTPEGTAITAGGAGRTTEYRGNIVENNVIRDSSEIDVFEAWGHDHVFKNNIILNITKHPSAETHIDFFQAFGNWGTPSYNITLENNFVSNLELGALGQISQGCGPDYGTYATSQTSLNCDTRPEVNGGITSVSTNTITDNTKTWITGAWQADHWKFAVVSIVSGSARGKVYAISANGNSTLTLQNNDGTTPNLSADGVAIGDDYEIRVRIGWVTYKNNVFHNVSNALSGSLPYLSLINNTYVNTATSFTGGSLYRGRALNGKATNNVFVDGGLYVPQQPNVFPAGDTLVKDTFDGNFNFASGAATTYAALDDRCPDGEYTVGDFCETKIWNGVQKRGINGGNPMFQNINNPLGADGIAWTSDDGFRPLAGSPLCTGGQNGGYIGAYPCAGSLTPPPSTSDTTAPSVPTGLSASAISSSQINLSWNNSTDNVGVTGYRIYRGGTQIATVTGTSYSNTGLIANTTYSYTVAAHDAANNVSNQSGSVGATTQAPPSVVILGDLLVKLVGSDLLTTSAPSGVQYRLDGGAVLSTNPNIIANVTAGTHTLYFTDATGYTESYATCTYTKGGTECTVTSPSSYVTTGLVCAGGLCTVPVSISQNTVTKIVPRYVSVPVNRAPIVVPITYDVIDVDPTRAGLQVYQGTTVTYFGTASDPDSNPVTWQWRYSIDGGADVVYSSGSGRVQPITFPYGSGTAGKTYVWKLRASDGSLSAESQQVVNVLASLTPIPTPTPGAQLPFGLGARITTTGLTNVYSREDGTLLGTKPQGSMGTIVGGPKISSSITWWLVDYDTAPDGWSLQSSLSVTASPTGDSDGDGISDMNDRCPGTPSILHGDVNTHGCPKPKASKFDVKPDFTSLNLREVYDLVLGESVYGTFSIESTEPFHILSDQNTYYGQLDLDTHITFAPRKITINSTSVPNLNKPATVTLYDVFVTTPKLLKDGVECTTCTLVSYDRDAGTLVFTVPGFSTYEVVEGSAVASPSPTPAPAAGSPGGGTTYYPQTTTPAPTPSTPTSAAPQTPIPAQVPTVGSGASSISTHLFYGSRSSEVIILQKLLNGNGYIVASSGAGSPGNEVPVFGPLTQRAIERFQCAKGIVCSGTPSTTGYGAVGPKTRAALNALPNRPVGTATLVTSAPGTTSSFIRSLGIGSTGNDVRNLQIFLNTKGFTVSASGNGSPGNETAYFGQRTRSALIRFQEAYAGQILTPLGLQRGTGYFGPSTIRVMNTLME